MPLRGNSLLFGTIEKEKNTPYVEECRILG
jgi:hypothetical protein